MRRGQVGTETIYIYGIAMLSVFALLVAFVYYDVGKFSFTKRQDTCAFTSQIECTDFIYDASAQNLSVYITNVQDFSLYNVTVQASGPCTGAGWLEGEDAILSLGPRTGEIYAIPCSLTKGEHIIYLTVNFTTAQNIDTVRTKQGYVRMRYQ